MPACKYMSDCAIERLHCFIVELEAQSAKDYNDDDVVCRGMPFDHEAVRNVDREYVRGEAHTQGIKSFWSLLKRAYKGTFHHWSAKHLDRYVAEFAGRYNYRDADTMEQMSRRVSRMIGMRLHFRDLTA